MNPELLLALRSVIDPELGLDVVSLGLVYAATRTAERAQLVMTLTSAACPLGELIGEDARTAIISRVAGVKDVAIEWVFEPRWSPERMSPEAKHSLGLP